MKKHYIVLLLYNTIMAIGLFVCNYFWNTPYTSDNFSRKFLVFMTLLAILALYHGLKHKSELTLSNKSKASYIPSMILFVPVVGFGIYSMITGFSPTLTFLILVIDTALIGIAEEGMYRVILLGSMVRKMHPVLALVLSSLLFCLLHVLNLIGGLSVSEVISQLGSTFVMGMFLGAMYLETKKPIFPVIFHSLWDYIILSGSLETLSFMPIALVGTYAAELLITLIIVIKLIKKKNQFRIDG
ncbi:CPBP family intramembrane metalloprotease [Suicoccus acidiformans]|uniref:CPBP family intramembrane metalloprotease n=1 Tax=Suicoccus acidiformans TaxID=2036206 RepID=A0A347WMC1_9LACT|nr:CPBP family intramembrane glutamic endopeptidase [Suicoccus acidiformans]AXY26228.1 CPBP family intramembrane metalloprotease [Suicoccus acidiformans]